MKKGITKDESASREIDQIDRKIRLMIDSQERKRQSEMLNSTNLSISN